MNSLSPFSAILIAVALCAAIAHIDWVPVAALVVAFLNQCLLVWAARDTTRTVEDEF